MTDPKASSNSDGGTLDRARRTIARVLEISPTEIAAETVIRELPNADSAALLEVIVALEDDFGVMFPDEVVFRLDLVRDVVCNVEALTCRAAA